MKKALKVFLAVLLVFATVLTFTACSGDGNNGKKGLLVKKIDGVYTVYDYVDADNGITELDIGAMLKLKGIDEEYNIKEGAFDGNDTLTKIIVSGKVKEIGAGAFKNMVNLRSLEVPFIGKTVKADAYYLESASSEGKSVDRERTLAHFFGENTYSAGTKVSINYGAGQAICFVPKNFHEVIVNATLTAEGKDSYCIPFNAFNGATNLYKVTLKGEKLGGIGDGAFNNCSKLGEVIVDGLNLDVLDNAFKGCGQLKYFGKAVDTVPDYVIDLASVKTAGKLAFDMGSNVYTVSNAGTIDLSLAFGETEIK